MTRHFQQRTFVASACIALVVSMPIYAVVINPHGLGQVLVYPYYTVNGNNSTLLTLINSSTDTKAVKVRFLEGYNGRDVLDFNLYLQPYDTWVSAVVESGDGAALYTNDASCTVPKLPSTIVSAMAFSTNNFNSGSTQGADGGPTGSSRTREGHIEVIEMGTVTNDVWQTSDSLKHHGDATDCSQVLQAWQEGGYWRSNAQTDIGPATGGLFGSGTIVNVPVGTVQSYNADAITQFYAEGGVGQHSAPDALTPNIASATSLSALVYTGNKVQSLGFKRGIDAVSAVFMVESLANEYWTGGGTAARSEWVITYPTKRFYVDPYYVGQSAQLPFEYTYGVTQSGTAVSYTDVRWVQLDREGKIAVPVCLAVGSCPSPRLLYDSQIVTFGSGGANGMDQLYGPKTPSNVLASNLVPMNLPASSPQTGWAILDFHQGQQPTSPLRLLTDTSGSKALIGQPVTGFWVTQLINGNADGKGILANYTALFRHKANARCINISDSSPCS
ncbi:MAG: hypothetical protein JSS16_01150 [Proteobacteria bacterium]|uniref:hypothetical protein n=1 Tax=Rudaea sp. TaxID=2136325 RepID=UPI001D44CA5E|nr:hypothetical protein [Pseudomonadota bacterium]MBS0567352.1 hypothetical protein [Pseudomonadota bacterium]